MKSFSNVKNPKKTKVSIEEKIALAIEKRTTTLNLSRYNISILPRQVFELTWLKKLVLSNNQIEQLPKGLLSLHELEEINLENNNIAYIPDFFKEFTTLKKINVNNNKLIGLDAISKIPNIRIVHAKDNKLNQVFHGKSFFGELIELDISDNQVEILEFEIIAPRIEVIRLNNNSLTYLPDYFFGFINLREFSASNNYFEEIPDFIFSLKNLQILNLSEVNLLFVSPSIGNLKKLTELYLSSNKIVSLPNNIRNLTELRVLDLTRNFLRKIPDLSSCLNLFNLQIAFNEIKALPIFLRKLKNLTWLIAWRCELSRIPDFIFEMENLKYLDLSDNNLQVVPRDIQKLKNLVLFDISNNKITRLPRNLLKLQKLERLVVYGNTELHLPEEITGTRTTPFGSATPAETILSYYFAAKTSSKPINEMKLVIVGRGAAGKTSIIKRLLSDEYDPNEEETPGIEINSWNVTCSNNEVVRLHTWDFGGQEILHATHQFFFSERCLYLLVLTGREDRQQSDAEYWLQLIGSFGGDSRVVIALNKSVSHPFDLNRQAILEKYPGRIVEFFKVDCASGLGINALRAAITDQVEQSEHRKVPFPSAWFGIKENLVNTKEDFLSWDNFSQLCNDLGENDKKNQELLAGYLHALGIALNYSKDTRLADTHVLNPRWVTEGVYKILRSGESTADPTVQVDQLSSILDVSRYPRNKYDFLLRLMELYHLCFKLPNDSTAYLMPELLTRNQPNIKPFIDNCDLSFCYTYSVLPEGLLPRFIVQTHTMSENLQRWRSGTELYWDNCSAVVISDQVDKIVSIHIKGPLIQRRQFLAIIRNKLDDQHKLLKSVKISEKIPLKEDPSRMLDYKDLILREQRNELKFFPENMTSPVDVRLLLDGVESQSERENRHVLEMKESKDAITINNYLNSVNQLIGGNMTHEKHVTNQSITGGTFNNSAIVAKANSFSWQQRIDAAEDSEIKADLHKLNNLIMELCKIAPAEVAEKAMKNVEIFTNEALSEKPDADYLKLSSKGLGEAATAVAGMTIPILDIVSKISEFLS